MRRLAPPRAAVCRHYRAVGGGQGGLDGPVADQPLKTGDCERGQAVVWALLAVFVLALVGAGLLDVYHWTTLRVWAYHAAESAAARAVVLAAWYNAADGAWQVDPAVASAQVETALTEALTLRGLDPATAAWAVRVHPESAPTAEPGYPPGGDLWGSGGAWTTDRPSVGVYLEVEAATFWGGLAGLVGPARLHVFAASSLVR